MAAIFEHSEPVQLRPKPGFVVKTKVLEGLGDHTFGKKVFINVCHDDQVPKPAGEFEVEAIFAKIVKNEWEIPIVVSLEKTAVDKKGVPSYVYDCCINSQCFLWIQLNNDLRLILIEWAIESVETMHDLVLEREYSIPKMLSKGELSETEITQDDLKNGLQNRLRELRDNETAALVQQLMPDDVESSESLPDLMNIGGGKKALIEEIEELSIEEKKAKRTETTETKPDANLESSIRLTRHGGDELMQVHTTTFTETTKRLSDGDKGDFKIISEPKGEMPQTNGSLLNTVEDYTFTLSQKIDRDNFHLIFHSPQLTSLLEVSYSQTSHTLRISNLDTTRRLGKLDMVDFPLPPNVQPERAFAVLPENKLYVFGKVRTV